MPLSLNEIKDRALAFSREWEGARAETCFAFVSQPSTEFLAIPSVSSERRQYIPVGFFTSDIVASNLCLIIAGAGRYHFGILSSAMHMAWMRYVAGRLKSDYRYSNQIVYNNFPWPEVIRDTESKPLPSSPSQGRNTGAAPLTRGDKGGFSSAIEHAAQGVLDARAAHANSSLADLYDPVAMPPDLRKAHQALDKAVDAAYGFGRGGSRTALTDAERVAFLFELYHKYTSLLPSPKTPKQRRRT